MLVIGSLVLLTMTVLAHASGRSNADDSGTYNPDSEGNATNVQRGANSAAMGANSAAMGADFAVRGADFAARGKQFADGSKRRRLFDSSDCPDGEYLQFPRRWCCPEPRCDSGDRLKPICCGYLEDRPKVCTCKQGFARNEKGQCVHVAICAIIGGGDFPFPLPFPIPHPPPPYGLEQQLPECNVNDPVTCGENESLQYPQTYCCPEPTFEVQNPGCCLLKFNHNVVNVCLCTEGFVRTDDGRCILGSYDLPADQKCPMNEMLAPKRRPCCPERTCDNQNPSCCGASESMDMVCQCKEHMFRDDNGVCVPNADCRNKRDELIPCE